jgi:hypothetical protein
VGYPTGRLWCLDSKTKTVRIHTRPYSLSTQLEQKLCCCCTGNPVPIDYTPAAIEYEDEDEPMAIEPELSEKSKGKRKAPPED